MKHVLLAFFVSVFFFGNGNALAKENMYNPTCVFPFAGQVTDEGVADMIGTILANCAPNDRLLIHVFSQGGSEQAAFTFYNFLRRWPGGVDTVAVGNVLSAAIPIFLAGEYRTIDWSSVILVHPASQFIQTDADIRFLRERTSMLRHNDDIYVSIIAERTGLTLGEVYRLNELSEVFETNRALELGFAHEVLPRP